MILSLRKKSIGGKGQDLSSWRKGTKIQGFFTFLPWSTTKNHISNLRIGDKNITKEKDISKEMVSFFTSLMTADPNIVPLNQEEILNVIPFLVTREQNKMLQSIPNDKEKI